MKFKEYLKCILHRGHCYGNAKLNPFKDMYGNSSAIYTCEKCGHKKFHIFCK